MSYEVAKSELCYKGAFLSVRKDEIVMPDGNTAFREVVPLAPAPPLPRESATSPLSACSPSSNRASHRWRNST